MSRRLWLWFSAVVAVFAAVSLVLMMSSEHRYKKEILSARLEGYADIVSRTDDFESLRNLLPSNIRVTVLGKDGTVFYDSTESAESLDNHLERPEIKDCIAQGYGYGLRYSSTSGKKYFYYAHLYSDRVVRTALPFEIQEMRFFRPSALMVWILFVMLVIALAATFIISRSFGKEAADRLQSQKRSMTNNIAHELRTPVTSIRGYLETLQMNPGMDEKHRQLFIDRAYSQSLRLSELIRDISLITKIEEAPEMLEKEEVCIREVIDEVIDELSKDIADGGFRTVVSVPEDLAFVGNPTLVYSIFRNLLENALRYSGSGSTIRIEGAREGTGDSGAGDRGRSVGAARDGRVEAAGVRSRELGGVLRFRFSDNGKGIPENQMDRIFERFYRIPGQDENRGEGSGLGLSIVRNAVAFHGGTIRARKVEPHGICFEFDLR